MIKKVLIAALVIILLLVGGFVIWGSTPAKPMPEALAALQSDAEVEVSNSGNWTVFTPAGSQPDTAFIFYPGGRVDYRAYAPLLREIASQGTMVVMTKMPLSLAVFSPALAAKVVEAYPEIDHWFIGGHSLGGAMAANYAAKHAGQVDGLILLGSYPAESDSLAGSDFNVISIYGSEDGGVDKIEASRALLPETAQFVEIEGGNHAQFGWYGLQNGDGTASIERLEQQQQAVEAIKKFLSSLNE